MTANEIRKKFLEFFASKGHTVVRSASLVPPEKEDETVLFTTAGMQQFKRQFLGQIDGYTRATTSQKCLRTDDLDCVGKTAFHHTFFEMLGNFSFGDYFKKEAIHWAWEFLTKDMALPVEKLWVSVYKEDSEAEKIWLNDIKIPANRLVRLGDKSNFWPSEAKENGPNGPCGPCSEIFFDYGVNPNCPKKEKCDPDCSCGRFSEVWNLVFTQFNRKDGGILEPLPAKNIDTGMGLERLVAVVQGKKSNYETDLFESIFKAINKEIVGIRGAGPSTTSKNIIADHIRAIVFGIADGVIPSNEGRGYVVRKLIVEISDIVVFIGMTKSVIYKLVPSVAQAMGEAYPEISEKAQEISKIIQRVEQNYIDVRSLKIPEFGKLVREINQSALSPLEKYKKYGELMFLFKDTHGLNYRSMFNIIEDFLPKNYQQEGDIVKDSFDSKMNEQKQRSRSSSKMTGDVFADAELNLNVPKTKFTGYESKLSIDDVEGVEKTKFTGHDTGSSQSNVIKIFRNNKEVESAIVGDDIKVVLNETPFYAESGGQVADIGEIWKGDMLNPDALLTITATQKISDVFIHSGKVEKGSFKADDSVITQINTDRRIAIMRNHTATHLLQAALRIVLGAHVQQQGSLVRPEYLRFDFTHHQSIPKSLLQRIEALINLWIRRCDEVKKEEMSLSEAKRKGALAFFAEKYGERVRVVEIDGYSKEFCGGTHLDRTGEIGLFKIINESAVAQGIRRIEAVTGTYSIKLIKEQEDQLEKIAQIVKSSFSEVVERVDSQTKRLKELEKEVESLRFEEIKNSVATLIQNAQTIKESKIISTSFKEVDAVILRKVSDLIKQKAQSAVAILASSYQGSAFILIAVTDDLVKKGVKANDLIKVLAPLIGGTGGGRPELAQAGSKEIQKIESAVQQAKQLIAEKI